MRLKYGFITVILCIIMLLCSCGQKENLSFDKVVSILSSNAIDEVLTAEYTDAQYCKDSAFFAGASVGLPFQTPLYDISSGKFRDPESGFWYSPIIRDRQVLAMLTIKSDGNSVSISLDGWLISPLSQTLKNTDSAELVVFWCNYSLFALDTKGQIHLLNAFPEKEIPTFPDNLHKLMYPSTDFTAILTPVSEHLNLTQ